MLGANDLNAMLGLEKMKEAAGCSDVTCAAEIGGALGVERLLVTTADLLGSKLLVTTTLIDAKLAEALLRARGEGPNEEDHYLTALEAAVSGTFAPRDVEAAGARVVRSRPGRHALGGFGVGRTSPSKSVGDKTNTMALYATGLEYRFPHAEQLSLSVRGGFVAMRIIRGQPYLAGPLVQLGESLVVSAGDALDVEAGLFASLAYSLSAGAALGTVGASVGIRLFDTVSVLGEVGANAGRPTQTHQRWDIDYCPDVLSYGVSVVAHADLTR